MEHTSDVSVGLMFICNKVDPLQRTYPQRLPLTNPRECLTSAMSSGAAAVNEAFVSYEFPSTGTNNSRTYIVVAPA